MSITGEQAAKLLEGTTPGPWMVNQKAATNVDRNGRGVAACGGYYDNTSNGAWADENRANARLTAAPDLARALIASEAARKLAVERLAKALGALQSIVDSYDATSELHTSFSECAANLYDFARVALKEIDNG